MSKHCPIERPCISHSISSEAPTDDPTGIGRRFLELTAEYKKNHGGKISSIDTINELWKEAYETPQRWANLNLILE
jgi:hypothetical protein